MEVTITWKPEDLEDAFGMSAEEATDFLARNGKHLRDRSIELGWAVLDDLVWEDNYQKENN